MKSPSFQKHTVSKLKVFNQGSEAQKTGLKVFPRRFQVVAINYKYFPGVAFRLSEASFSF